MESCLLSGMQYLGADGVVLKVVVAHQLLVGSMVRHAALPLAEDDGARRVRPRVVEPILGHLQTKERQGPCEKNRTLSLFFGLVLVVPNQCALVTELKE